MASIEIVDGIDPSSLRLFLAAVELGSVSKAAARMHVSQPSATAKLQKLERQLGLALLERTATGSRPTDAGARLAPACAEAIGSVASLVDRAEAIRAEGDRLTIATTRHVADHYLPGWIRRTPGVPIDVIELDTLRVARTVRDGGAMVGFTEGPAAPIGLRSTVVGTEPIRIVVGRTHPWYGRRSAIAADEIASATVISSRPGSGTRDVVEAAFAAHEWGSGEVIEVANASAARLTALTGAGVAFLPDCWVSALFAAGDLMQLPVRETSIELPVRVVWRGNRPASAAARRFVDAVVDAPA